MRIDDGIRYVGFKRRMLRCQIWGFIPVFGFIAFLCMADNAGEERYSRLGKKFFVFTMAALATAVSADLIIYLTTVCLGTRAAAYARSVTVTAWIMLPVIYLIQLVKMLLIRKEYLEKCEMRYRGEAAEDASDEEKKDGKTDINSCSRGELIKLPGIDAAMAMRILKDREAQGGFASVEEFIDRYDIKPHFAAGIIEKACIGDGADMAGGEEYSGSWRTKPVRAIDI